MHRTVEALEQKLSVGDLLDEMWLRMREGGLTSAASTAAGTIRDHPVPAALMGLGLAWLALEQATRHGDGVAFKDGNGQGSEHVEGFERADGNDFEDDFEGSISDAGRYGANEPADGAIERAKEKVASAVHRTKEKASSAMENAREGASEAGGRIRGGVNRTKSDAKERARRVGEGVRSALDEQPLALGAVAFGLGLASGLAVPTTRWEDRAFGQAAADVKHQAKGVVDEVRHAVHEGMHRPAETLEEGPGEHQPL